MTIGNFDSSQKVEEFENVMNCARWLAQEFENINYPGIAAIFHKAVSDAEVFIQTMVAKGQLPKGCCESIKAHEAAAIHNILVRYASIEDPNIRKRILEDISDHTTLQRV